MMAGLAAPLHEIFPYNYSPDVELISLLSSHIVFAFKCFRTDSIWTAKPSYAARYVNEFI